MLLTTLNVELGSLGDPHTPGPPVNPCTNSTGTRLPTFGKHPVSPGLAAAGVGAASRYTRTISASAYCARSNNFCTCHLTSSGWNQQLTTGRYYDLGTT